MDAGAKVNVSQAKPQQKQKTLFQPPAKGLATKPKTEKVSLAQKTQNRLMSAREQDTARGLQQNLPKGWKPVDVVGKLAPRAAPTILESVDAETRELLIKLAFFDSIHDFWPERGKKKSTGEDAAEPEEGLDDPKGRIEAVHNKLVETIQTYLGSADPIETILKNQTDKQVYSPRSLEDPVLAYFKKKYKPFNEPEVSLTVKDILTKWRLREDYGNDWEKYRAAILSLPNTAEVLIDGTYVKTLETVELGYLGFFILAFMNPEENPGKSTRFLTFDMAAANIGLIFTRFSQVYNAIYPQNVADSAPTSFDAIPGRSKFFRADYTDALTAKGPVRFPAQANAFTRDKYEIAFVDQGFGPKNRFGFFLEIKDKASGTVISTVKFGNGKEQGPSVNYLMDLLTKGPVEAKPKLEKVAEFSNPENIDQNLLFDIKRLGDQEQMSVPSSTYGVTGDRLAGAFRRALRKPGIYQSTKGFRMWRGRAVVSEEEIVDYRKTQILEKLKIVAEFLKPEDELGTIASQLKEMTAEVKSGLEYGVVFRNPIRITGNLTEESIYSNYTDIASTFATYLLRLRMKDIYTYLNAMVEQSQAIADQIPALDEAACLAIGRSLTEKPCPPGDPASLQQLNEAFDKLDAFVSQVTILSKMNVSFTKWMKTGAGEIEAEVAPIYTQLFGEVDEGPTRRLIKGATSSFFNFSGGAFTNAETGLATVVARLLVLSRGNVEANGAQVNKLLVQYFQARDEIKEAFYDEEIKRQVEEATDITSGLSPTQILKGTGGAGQGLLEAIQTVASAFEGEAAAPAAPAAPAEPQPVIQMGGAPPKPHLQFRELHDIFAKLCINAEVARNAGVNPVDALNELETTWVTSVDEMRTHSEEDYGVKFQDTDATDYISWMLSHRTFTDEQGNPAAMAGALFNLEDPILYPGLTERRAKVQFNDLALILGTQLPVEEFILRVLENMQLVLLGDHAALDGIPATKYSSPAGWKYIPGAIYSVAYKTANGEEIDPELKGILQGGGLEGGDESSSNAAGNATGSSRRRLYTGLRKRSGSGTPPEL